MAFIAPIAIAGASALAANGAPVLAGNIAAGSALFTWGPKSDLSSVEFQRQ